jgi:hypothetical protein
VLWKLSIFFHTVVYQRNFCDPYSWNNNHGPANPRVQQMLSGLFQKLRQRKKEKKKRVGPFLLLPLSVFFRETLISVFTKHTSCISSVSVFPIPPICPNSQDRCTCPWASSLVLEKRFFFVKWTCRHKRVWSKRLGLGFEAACAREENRRDETRSSGSPDRGCKVCELLAVDEILPDLIFCSDGSYDIFLRDQCWIWLHTR